MLLQHLLSRQINFIIFLLLETSVCDEVRQKVYPRMITRNRAKRESNLAQNLEVNCKLQFKSNKDT